MDAQRKRKTSPDASSSLFTMLPSDAWDYIAGFAAPPSIYNLALSSRHFHTVPTRGPADGGSGRASRRRNAGQQQQPPVLATRLLRESLLSGLRRVLENSKSGITLTSALDLADAVPAGSAVIAGSTMAQTCLGVLWKGQSSYRPVDVDVYCTAKAAPLVRSWLVDKAECMFIGFKDYRIELTDKRLLYTVDTKIHHVEHFGSLAENVDKNESQEEYYKTTSEWGKNCQKNYVDWKWKNGMSLDVLGVDLDKAYNIKPKAGGDLPFDFDGDGSIDLIVARTGKGTKKKAKKGKSAKKKAAPVEITPFDLLEDFDLTICKASFDGRTFRIPEPHLTFAGKTTMEPNRQAIVRSYVKHFKPPESGYLEPMEQSQLAIATIGAVKKDVPNVPFYNLVDFAASLPDRYTGDFMGRGSMYDPMVQAKIGPPIQFHNWTKKLVDRLRKYQARGIEVIGAPTIGDGIILREFSLST